ncbi:MAG: hypothetical protein NWR51_06160 [Akkermansiaceae bacterium]|nr:hypothetical protein [Akkermansiaceae bacterium]
MAYYEAFRSMGTSSIIYILKFFVSDKFDSIWIEEISLDRATSIGTGDCFDGACCFGKRLGLFSLPWQTLQALLTRKYRVGDCGGCAGCISFS